MSLTSYRAAPSRVKALRREAGCSSALGKWEPLGEIYFCTAINRKFREPCAALAQNACVGKALLSVIIFVGKGFETKSSYSAVMTCVAL
jgi:hypothetical protein